MWLYLTIAFLLTKNWWILKPAGWTSDLHFQASCATRDTSDSVRIYPLICLRNTVSSDVKVYFKFVFAWSIVKLLKLDLF